jgi:hypothetical protein
MSTELTLQEGSEVYNELKISSKELSAKVDKIEVTDAATLGILNQNLSILSEKVKEVAKIHKKEKQPSWDICKGLDLIKKELSTPMDISLDKGKKKVLVWNNKVRAAAAAEALRIENIKTAITKYSTDAMTEFEACKTEPELVAVHDRIIVNYPKDKWGEFLNDFLATRVTLNDYAKSVRTRLRTPKEVDPEEAAAIKEAVVEGNNAIGSTQVVEAVVVQKGIRKTWSHKLIDITKVPIDWLTIDEDKVKAWRKANSTSLTDGEVRDGVKFFQVESLSVR